MTEEDRRAVGEALSKSIAKTEKQIAELEELTGAIAPENAIGRVSRMDAINNRSVNEASLRKARQRLIKLKHNAEKLPKADFGQCTRCGETIQLERLIFMPESHLCTPCARRG